MVILVIFLLLLLMYVVFKYHEIRDDLDIKDTLLQEVVDENKEFYITISKLVNNIDKLERKDLHRTDTLITNALGLVRGVYYIPRINEVVEYSELHNIGEL